MATTDADQPAQTTGPPAPPAQPTGADPQVIASIRTLLGLIAAMAVIALMRAAGPVVIPFLVALFGTVIAAPVVLWLSRRRVPNVAAVLIVVAALGGFGLLVGMVLLDSIDRFMDSLPLYAARLNEKLAAILPPRRDGALVSWHDLLEQVEPGQAMGMIAKVLAGVRDLITSTFLITLLMVFMLLDLPASLDRIRLASGQRRGPMDYIARVASGLRRYFAIKTAISLVTGLLAGTLVYAMGVDYPLLWGLMAFLFNFIPAIGSILAAIPPVILAFISSGPTDALIIAAGYLVINGVLGNMIEPRVTGLGLGLTTLTVFASLLFWGWVLGPVGLLLSVPLTLALKLGLENHPRTRWVSILMGG